MSMIFERIAVGIDFSRYSEVARMRAYELAKLFAAEVILVHAFEDSDYRGQRAWLPSTESFERLLARSQQVARSQMESLATIDKPPGIRVQDELTELEPDQAIACAAERHDVDLVVIGTHGRTGFARLPLARVTERVVRNSPCSVLVARPLNANIPPRSRILARK